MPNGEEESDAHGFWQRVATNLAAARLRLLFVADEIPDPPAQDRSEDRRLLARCGSFSRLRLGGRRRAGGRGRCGVIRRLGHSPGPRPGRSTDTPRWWSPPLRSERNGSMATASPRCRRAVQGYWVAILLLLVIAACGPTGPQCREPTGDDDAWWTAVQEYVDLMAARKERTGDDQEVLGSGARGNPHLGVLSLGRGGLLAGEGSTPAARCNVVALPSVWVPRPRDTGKAPAGYGSARRAWSGARSWRTGHTEHA